MDLTCQSIDSETSTSGALAPRTVPTGNPEENSMALFRPSAPRPSAPGSPTPGPSNRADETDTHKRSGLRVSGVPVRLTGPALILTALLVLSLATGLLPQVEPGQTAAAYWAAGLVGGVGVIASLLLRDAAHVLFRRRFGLPVPREITALGAGGGMPPAPTPRLEARLAVVGPLANLLAAGVVGGVAALLGATGAAPLLVAVGSYLAGLNLLLVAVHLLPGLPLDGGRLLRAWRWSRTGDRSRATYLAAGMGRAIGVLLLVGGGVQLVLGSLTGLWTALVGFFLMTAARQEARSTQVHDALSGLTVRDALVGAGRPAEPGALRTVAAWTTVDALLDEHPDLSGLDAVVVLHGFDGSTVGVVPLVALAAVPADRRADLRLRDVAVPSELLPVARLDEQLVDVLGRPASVTPTTAAALALAGYVLVTDSAPGTPADEQRVVGVLTAADLARTSAAGALRNAAGRVDLTKPNRSHDLPA